MPFHTHRLPNGLQLIGETIPTARSACAGFFVRTGSRDETPAEAGVSHFLEHMMFKGTARRSALDVNRDFDRIGADYNAYTSEEATVYYAAVLPEYLADAADVLADILRPSLRADDFATEQKVILEEIKRHEDNPGSEAWDRGRRIYYADHPLGNTILGSAASVSALTPEGMRAYFDRRYAAPNVLVAAAGQFDWDAWVADIAAKCGAWPATDPGPRTLGEPPGAGGVHPLVNAAVAQQQILAFCPGPPAESPLRYAASVIANAIGDDTGSRLYWELVDPGLVESANTGADPNHGSGLLVSAISCDPDGAAEAVAILRRVLAAVQRDGLTDAELTAAKNKIASRVVRQSERPTGRMWAVAEAWLYRDEYSDVDRELARFDAVDAAAVRACLDRYPVDRPTIVGYGPVTSLE
jgi:predicted Zn-dependent peptidase